MSQSAIFFPALVQALLSIGLLFLLGPARARSMRAAKQSVADRDVALGQNPWSDEATRIANNYKNQYEVPVLFYAIVAFAILFKQADGLMTSLAWVFALSRLVHTAIQVGPNVVMWRAAAFLVGVAALLAMWLLLGFRLWTGV